MKRYQIKKHHGLWHIWDSMQGKIISRRGFTRPNECILVKTFLNEQYETGLPALRRELNEEIHGI